MDRFRNTRQPDWDWWGRLWPTPGATLRRIGVTAGASLAEIGSGNGYFALPAARITDPEPVYAIDVDESLLDELAHLAERQGIENVVPIHGDARALAGHLPEPVDTCLLADLLHGIEAPAAVLGQVSDALAEGGELLVVNWTDLPRDVTTVEGEPRGPPTELRLSPDETRRIVLDAIDLTLTERIELPPYHHALRFQR